MKSQGAPIIHLSERLLREVVRTAARMPKDYKWIVGARLRDDAIECLLLTQKAFRSARHPAVALPLLAQLADRNDAIQALLQVGYDVRAIPTAGQLRDLATLARDIGQQCGGWMSTLKQRHPQGQNLPPAAASERSGALSTQGASQADGPKAQG